MQRSGEEGVLSSPTIRTATPGEQLVAVIKIPVGHNHRFRMTVLAPTPHHTGARCSTLNTYVCLQVRLLFLVCAQVNNVMCKQTNAVRYSGTASQ